jgi:GxxExxY protein
MTENEISYLIRKCIFRVYTNLGPGLFESVYERVLIYELRKEGLKVSSQKPVPLYYDDMYLDVSFRLDVLVEDKMKKATLFPRSLSLY